MTGFRSALIILLPVMLILFLGSQMATRQAQRQFDAHERIPAMSRLADLQTLPADTVVMLRGRLVERPCNPPPCASDAASTDVIVYQEQPAEGREIRFQETFPQHFPPLLLEVEDGRVALEPSLTRQRVLRHTAHTASHGDRQRSGFRLGDRITAQGQWQPQTATGPALIEVTGISGIDKQPLTQEWQEALQTTRWLRNLFGLITALGLVAGIVELRRRRSRTSREKAAAWPQKTTTDAPTTSP